MASLLCVLLVAALVACEAAGTPKTQWGAVVAAVGGGGVGEAVPSGWKPHSTGSGGVKQRPLSLRTSPFDSIRAKYHPRVPAPRHSGKSGQVRLME